MNGYPCNEITNRLLTNKLSFLKSNSLHDLEPDIGSISEGAKKPKFLPAMQFQRKNSIESRARAYNSCSERM